MEDICLSLVKKLVTFSNLSIEEDDLEIYAYGLLSYIYTLIPLTILLISATLFHTTLEMLTWIITFVSLRKYAGGYHAKTPTLCFLSSVLLGISSLIICTNLQMIFFPIYIISIMLNAVILLLLAPATHKEFTKATKIRCKIKVALLLFIFSSIYIFLPTYQSYYLYALVCTSSLCIAQKCQKC